jgi:hypothetical protein
VGGLAVALVGEPRTTADADVIAFLDTAQAEALLRRAAKAGFDVGGRGAGERLRETGTLSLKRGKFHLDMILASSPLEEAALRRASSRKLFGRALLVPTPEDLVILKVLAGRDKDLLDAEGVLRRHRGKLDLGYVEEALRSVCGLAEDMDAWRRWESCLRNSGSRQEEG